MYTVSAIIEGIVKNLYSGTDLHQASVTYNWAMSTYGNAALIRR